VHDIDHVPSCGVPDVRVVQDGLFEREEAVLT
jgi:hypothetical protein